MHLWKYFGTSFLINDFSQYFDTVKYPIKSDIKRLQICITLVTPENGPFFKQIDN